MTIGAISAHIGAVVKGVRPVSGEASMNLGVAFEIDKYARETTRIEIRRDRISVRHFLDGGTVGQHVETGKAEDLEPRIDPVRLGRRCRCRPSITRSAAAIAGKRAARAKIMVATLSQ